MKILNTRETNCCYICIGHTGIVTFLVINPALNIPLPSLFYADAIFPIPLPPSLTRLESFRCERDDTCNIAIIVMRG